MKKKGFTFKLSMFIVILSIISVCFSFIFLKDSKLEEIISFSSILIRLIFTISTFVIAVLLYDRFNFRKNIFERKLDLVFDLLIKLKKLRIVIHPVNKQKIILGSIDVKKNMLDQHILKDINLFSYVVFDAVNLYNNKSIHEIKNIKDNPFLPKEISDSLNFLFPILLTMAESNEDYKDKFVQIDFNNESKLKPFDIKDWMYPDEE